MTCMSLFALFTGMFFSNYFISTSFEWKRTTWRNQWSTNMKEHRKIVKILMSLHYS